MLRDSLGLTHFKTSLDVNGDENITLDLRFVLLRFVQVDFQQTNWT